MTETKYGVRRELWLPVLALASVFLVGTTCGVLLDRTLLNDELVGPRGLGVRTPDPFTEIGVTPEQRRKLDQIFERHRAELDAAVRESEPKLRAISERIEGEIQETLTPPQREQLKRIRERPFEMALPAPPPSVHGAPHGEILPAPFPMPRGDLPVERQ